MAAICGQVETGGVDMWRIKRRLERPRAGLRQIRICKIYLCGKYGKTSDAVFIPRCLDVYLGVRRGIQRRMSGKNPNMQCVLFPAVYGMRLETGCMIQRCSRWHVGGSRWRRREPVCGQTLANASSAVCVSANLQVRRERRYKKLLQKPKTRSDFVDPTENRWNKNKMSSDNPRFRAVNIHH